jgi:hypothetical protein
LGTYFGREHNVLLLVRSSLTAMLVVIIRVLGIRMAVALRFVTVSRDTVLLPGL